MDSRAMFSSQMTVRSKLLRLMGIAFQRTYLAQEKTAMLRMGMGVRDDLMAPTKVRA